MFVTDYNLDDESFEDLEWNPIWSHFEVVVAYAPYPHTPTNYAPFRPLTF